MLTAVSAPEAAEIDKMRNELLRLPETFQWLLVPEQSSPRAALGWRTIRITGQDPLAERASKRLRGEELLAQYPYLHRVAGPSVIVGAVRDGTGLLTWEKDSFAWADENDEAAKRYRGLRGGEPVSVIDADSPGLLVKPEVAVKQMEREARPVRLEVAPGAASVGVGRGFTFGVRAYDADGRPLQVSQARWSATGGSIDETGVFTAGEAPGQFTVEAEFQGLRASATVTICKADEVPPPPPPPPELKPKRFHGTVDLNPERVGRDAGRIAEEIISHLAGKPGAEVAVTLEIEAKLPGGADDALVRTVTENARTLQFKSQGFERE